MKTKNYKKSYMVPLKESENREESETWSTGTGVEVRFSEICHQLAEYTTKDTKFFIGSDSDITNRKITFCKAICIYGPDSKSHYFFSRNKTDIKTFPNLFSRMAEEARLSVDLAIDLNSKYQIPLHMIEIHLDVSPLDKGSKTSIFSDALKGYVRGAGFRCEIKPNAWASQSVADRHSK